PRLLSTLFPYTTLFRSLPRSQSGCVVAECLEYAAVDLIGAALGHQRDRCRPRVPRAGPAGLDPELLHRVQSRLNARDTSAEPVRSEEHTSELQSPDHLV